MKPFKVISLSVILIVCIAFVGDKFIDRKPQSMFEAKQVFRNEAFDFEFLRAMSYSAYRGSELNECYKTAYRIRDNDVDSWYREWFKTASEIHAVADQCLKEGHDVSARDAYLRASNYYRTAEFFYHEASKRPKALVAYRKSRACFLKAGQLFETKFEAVNIPFEGKTLPGYLFKVDNSVKPRPTVIAVTGYDGTAEEMYFQVAAAALERGYNVLSIDGPGQGAALREKQIYFRPDWENVAKPVVDYLISRPEVDPKKIAICGYSVGGYFAPRAVTSEHRIAACVTNPGCYSFFEASLGDQAKSKSFLKQLEAKESFAISAFCGLMMKINTGFNWKMQDGMWKFNVKTPHQVLGEFRKYTLDGRIDQIKCPVLVCRSEGEHILEEDQDLSLFNKLKSPKTLLVFSKKDWTDVHCQDGLIQVGNQRILDWLDKTLQVNVNEL